MKKDILYINKPTMTMKELVDGWKARVEGMVKWVDCQFCTYQIVGPPDYDAMPEMGSHRLTCKRKDKHENTNTYN